MISKNVESAINEQIRREEFSSRLYLSMASWCEVNGFPGAAQFLFEQADEEKDHMMKLVHYLNDRGGRAMFTELESPQSKFDDIRSLFEKVLEHERYITQSINDLYGVCMAEKDYTTGNFLQWYINEQIEEESTMQTILDKMNLIGSDKSGFFFMDKEFEAIRSKNATEE